VSRPISLLLSFLLLSAILLNACKDGADIPQHPTFTQHVAPILHQNCTGCHRVGGSGHFALETYPQAKAYAASIAFVVHEHIMPPWPADPTYTQFLSQRVLSARDKQIIEKWIAEGTPEGPAAALPQLPVWKGNSGLGKPDLRLAVTPVFLKANGGDRFLLVKVPFELPSDTFASVIEFEAGRHNVVHHVNGDMVSYEEGKKKDIYSGTFVTNMIDDSTIKLAFEQLGLPNDDGTYPVLRGSVVNYLPGVYASIYPPGIGGIALPKKGAFLLKDIHYGNSKTDVWDSSFINVYFTRSRPGRPLLEFQLGTLGVAPVEPDLLIQPNTTKHVISRYRVPESISILTVNPHMHLLGKTFKAYALAPGGDTIRLISIPRWDFNWQYFYTFPKMVKIPAGSTIIAEGTYDNTKQNLNNPFTPPQLVRDQKGSMRSTDEMFQFIVSYLPYQDGDENIALDPRK
jgi:hypothetical protein